MATPPISAVSLRRRMNEAAQQLRIIAGNIDRDANDLFQRLMTAESNAYNLEKELEAAVEQFYILRCDGCILDGEGGCCK